jgi:hypothetical protein
VVTQDGEPVEVTDDWYAQDSDGNVWYLGEDTAEYERVKSLPPRAPGRPASTGRAVVPLEPRILEHKFYARGVGPVLVLDVSGAAGREELTEFTEVHRSGRCGLSARLLGQAE